MYDKQFFGEIPYLSQNFSILFRIVPLYQFMSNKIINTCKRIQIAEEHKKDPAAKDIDINELTTPGSDATAYVTSMCRAIYVS